MDIARQVASRATCDRKHVGALLVRDRIILSTGYNGSIRGLPHCDEAGHMMENGHCVATVHAEANATSWIDVSVGLGSCCAKATGLLAANGNANQRESQRVPDHIQLHPPLRRT